MNYKMIDLLDKAVESDNEKDKEVLRDEGVLTSDNQIVANKINLMSGAFVADLMGHMEEADMNTGEVLSHVKILYRNKQYMGIYYFLLYLFEAVEIQIPYLFMQMPAHEEALEYYIHEIIADMQDCHADISD